MGGSGGLKDTYELSINSKTVTKKCDMLIEKYFHSLCKHGYLIFSIGGWDSSKVSTNDCERYDSKNDKWVSLPNLLYARYWCAAFNFNNEWVYALGGKDGDPINKVERLSI